MEEKEKGFTIGISSTSVFYRDLHKISWDFLQRPIPTTATWVRQATLKLKGASEASVNAAGRKAPDPNEQEIARRVCLAVSSYCAGKSLTVQTGDAGGFFTDIFENRLDHLEWDVLRHAVLRELNKIPGFPNTTPKDLSGFITEITLMIRASADVIVKKLLPLVQKG
ncbi:MAG: hypothetical protein Q7N87_01815 [Candidatus Uhrbacteria bacterium]|nr:hypothetical protein [Candidatus Uhrbacteria bacterium]